MKVKHYAGEDFVIEVHPTRKPGWLMLRMIPAVVLGDRDPSLQAWKRPGNFAGITSMDAFRSVTQLEAYSSVTQP